MKGIGIGTVMAAFTMGKVIGIIGDFLDRHFVFDIYHHGPGQRKVHRFS